jgi:hypothetical protein
MLDLKVIFEIQNQEDNKISEILANLFCKNCGGRKKDKTGEFNDKVELIEHTELECNLEFTKQIIES